MSLLVALLLVHVALTAFLASGTMLNARDHRRRRRDLEQ
jgi:hypothetical protein